jgi:hypothetical protein
MSGSSVRLASSSLLLNITMAYCATVPIEMIPRVIRSAQMALLVPSVIRLLEHSHLYRFREGG